MVWPFFVVIFLKLFYQEDNTQKQSINKYTTNASNKQQKTLERNNKGEKNPTKTKRQKLTYMY